MKNLLGQLYKILFVLIFLVCTTSLAAYCYETIILHYPDRDWRIISYERKEEEQEVIAKFIPQYDNKNYWVEMLIFHSYRGAKDEQADTYLDTALEPSRAQFPDMELTVEKTSPEDTIRSWCSKKGNKKDPPQCSILRVTKGHESMITVEYITRDIRNFENRKKIWLPVLQNAVVYYSYFRWDRMLNKAICVEM